MSSISHLAGSHRFSRPQSVDEPQVQPINYNRICGGIERVQNLRLKSIDKRIVKQRDDIILAKEFGVYLSAVCFGMSVFVWTYFDEMEEIPICKKIYESAVPYFQNICDELKQAPKLVTSFLSVSGALLTTRFVKDGVFNVVDLMQKKCAEPLVRHYESASIQREINDFRDNFDASFDALINNPKEYTVLRYKLVNSLEIKELFKLCEEIGENNFFRLVDPVLSEKKMLTFRLYQRLPLLTSQQISEEVSEIIHLLHADKQIWANFVERLTEEQINNPDIQIIFGRMGEVLLSKELTKKKLYYFESEVYDPQSRFFLFYQLNIRLKSEVLEDCLTEITKSLERSR